MGKDTVDAMADFTTAQRKSRVAMMGLQITFAKFATPYLTDALTYVQDFTRVLNDPSLTKAQKLSVIRQRFRDLADDILGVLSDLGPEIAQSAGELGVIAARAIAKAFVETGFLGKVAIGALLIRSFGGPAAIIGAGRTVGAMISAGMAQGTMAKGTYGLARSFKKDGVKVVKRPSPPSGRPPQAPPPEGSQSPSPASFQAPSPSSRSETSSSRLSPEISRAPP
jgi:hypothetical protein